MGWMGDGMGMRSNYNFFFEGGSNGDGEWDGKNGMYLFDMFSQ